ncbi:ubiquitin-conjugating enzyme/RWD-like protein [Thamnocephalis sphaerospora]|uniref:Ubiquitin-conjugating enzyme E2 Z n=1 Tax=Thamnocephalis sphaerospora TaxID=78915 RepID=A0A4P9XJV9_9FUNG|nr:ubiquitin-conjugating enzyme/RWD-like protein [Thamnocephalis sphaerospora]RKP06706.1 ubiquitin-conjugating enzyme/RWD-like protein [Thamnocephalis sphaerospora]|eukprot:RKP06077.1 ubiquitin-conjugating enzyme/RWD-like protein [Thamnocephalis sphaerospora]
MSDQATLRLQRELLEYSRTPDDQIFIKYNDENIMQVRALIIGPVNTPYSLGAFEFKLEFPRQYPTLPPTVHILTTDGGVTRFNPNLYAGGKVCLSILGTWAGEAGEQWSPAQSISSVLLSIQSLMSENPYENEPGYGKNERNYLGGAFHSAKSEKKEDKKKNEEDTVVSEAAATKEAEETFDLADGESPAAKFMYTNDFADICKRLLLWHYDNYVDICEKESARVEDGEEFRLMPFEFAGNGMQGEFAYASLLRRLAVIKKAVLEEEKNWIEQSAQWLADDSGTAANLRGQYEQIVNSGCLEGVDIELESDNPYIWNVVIFGKPLSQYDGGLFRLRMVFHDQFPEVLPRATFATPVYHPLVTEGGVPYYRVIREEDVKAHIKAICDLFVEDPTPNPSAHVNRKAAALYFGDAEERRQYFRNVRRCAARSIEY